MTKRNAGFGPNQINQREHSASAEAGREVEHGFVIGINIADKATGVHNGASGTAILIGENRHILCTNLNAGVQYVTFGASGVAAGSAANGVPIPIGGQVRLCSGENEYVRTSNNDVHIVEIAD